MVKPTRAGESHGIQHSDERRADTNFDTASKWHLDLIAGDAQITTEMVHRAFTSAWVVGPAYLNRCRRFICGCPECFEADFHTPLFQIKSLPTCPVHGWKLKETCERCGQKRPYLAQGISGIVIPHYVGPTLAKSEIQGHIFRAFYIDVLVFEVIGERYELPHLIDELQRLEERLNPHHKSSERQ